MARAAGTVAVADQLAEIAAADRSALIDRWRVLHSAPPPKSLSMGFLRSALSYEVQCKASKGPSAQLLRDLKRQTSAQGTTPLAPGLRPGNQLLREWNGHTYRVTVTETGFVMAGQTWRSLSALARHITGAHWSGPRFFGLQARKTADHGSAQGPAKMTEEDAA
jgi:hypothetical protein